MLGDENFPPGELKFLVVGNECRLLDMRRTPGIVIGNTSLATVGQ
jgi:hypothetical protein